MDKKLFVFMKHGDALHTLYFRGVGRKRVGMSGYGTNKMK